MLIFFLRGPKNTVEEVCKRTSRLLIPERDRIERTLRPSRNNGFQDQYGNPLSLLELQQTKRRRSFLLVRRAKRARHENDQSAALVSRALGARVRVHFSH